MGQSRISPLADKSRWLEKSIKHSSQKTRNRNIKASKQQQREQETQWCGSLSSNPGRSACYSILWVHCSPWKPHEFRKKTDVGIFQCANSFGVSPQGKLKREVTGKHTLLCSCTSCPSSFKKVKSQEVWMHITQATGNTQGNYAKAGFVYGPSSPSTAVSSHSSPSAWCPAKRQRGKAQAAGRS